MKEEEEETVHLNGPAIWGDVELSFQVTFKQVSVCFLLYFHGKPITGGQSELIASVDGRPDASTIPVRLPVCLFNRLV